MRDRFDTRDGWLSLLLFAAAVAYLSSLPRNLGSSDESYFLYEAKRIRDGEVMYRDIFQFVTPLSSYAMASLFWLFGTTMAVARVSMAVLHAATGVVLYATARRLAVRRELAATVVLAYLALDQATWPYASWHWFSTSVSAVLLLVMIAGPWAKRPRWAFVPGVVNGILIGVQQQKGVPLAVGVCLVFAFDHLTDRRYPSPEPWRQVAARVLYFAAGIAAIVVPLLGTFVLLAGAAPLYRAMVAFPLDNYHDHFRSRWGMVGWLTQQFADYTMPAIVRYSPLAMLLPFSRATWILLRGGDRDAVRRRTALIVLSGFSAMSIWYYPDLIHVAFIAGSFWVCAADGLEGILSAVRSPRQSRVAGALVAAGIAFGLAFHLVGTARLMARQFPFAHQTAFGRVDFAAAWEGVLVDEVRERLAQSPSPEIFCYPTLCSPYLTTGGRNPTPYQFLDWRVSPEQQTREALSILQERHVPYILSSPLFIRPGDPIAQFIKDHYEFVRLPRSSTSGELQLLGLYRRIDQVERPDDTGGH